MGEKNVIKPIAAQKSILLVIFEVLEASEASFGHPLEIPRTSCARLWLHWLHPARPAQTAQTNPSSELTVM